MGRATAERFAAEGADVGMCARSEPELRLAAESVRSHGVRVVATPADLVDPEQTGLQWNALSTSSAVSMRSS